MENITKINVNGVGYSIQQSKDIIKYLKEPVLLNTRESSPIGAFSVELDLSSYYAVLIGYGEGTAYGPFLLVPIGRSAMFSTGNSSRPLNGSDTFYTRKVTVNKSSVSFSNGCVWGNNNATNSSIPVSIYGVDKDFYDAVQPIIKSEV